MRLIMSGLQKFELHWLGLVKNNTERLELYSQEIGSERIPSAQYKELGWTGHPELDPLIEEIYLARKYQASKGQNALRARVVYQFFTAMKEHFVSSFLTIRPGGYYCFSVGDQSTILRSKPPDCFPIGRLCSRGRFSRAIQIPPLVKES